MQYKKKSYGDLTPFLASNDGEKWFRKNHFEIQWWPLDLLTCQANSAFLGRFFCTGQQ
jgi:hypothetical protein